MPLSAGDKLGPYEILEPLGSGGMGEVWKARDPRLNRVVAIKRLKGEHSARFEQEARAIAALNHPHICQIYDAGPDYLVMEFIEGQSLRGPLQVEDALRIAIQIASALEEAHNRQILHRDLKPANILVTKNGTAKLLDFGLAKLIRPSELAGMTETMEGTLLGTAAYMSPEQAQGKPLDERSDVFSFGVVLYEMLGGKRAFAGGSMLETLNAVVRDEPAPLQSPAQEIVKRCLAKQPAQRFQSMTEVRAALEGVVAKPAQRPPSIAVLPFANMSSDKENEYFSDGLSEEIINALTKLPGLKVIARTSSFAFRGKELDIRNIAEALDVRTILEGSVRKAGNRVRVTAQLINAEDGAHVWSERYDRELLDVFAIQDEISAAIAGQLKVSLGGSPRTERRPLNLAAFEAFMEGRHHWLKLTPAGVTKSLACYRRAISADPAYALAHAGIAEHYVGQAMLGLANPVEVLPLARSAAERALELDSNLADAHCWAAHAALFLDWDWTASERHFRRAIELSPEPGTFTRFPYALWHLISKARWTEALAEMNFVISRDPLYAPAHYGKVLTLYFQARIDEAAAAAERAFEIDPANNLNMRGLIVVRARQGRLKEALAIAERALQLEGRWPLMLGYAGVAHAMAGERDQAHAYIEEIRETGAKTGFVPAEHIAKIYSQLGELDHAFEWAHKAVDQREPSIVWIGVDPLFDPLRTDARYPFLLRRLNLDSGQ